MAAAFHGFMCAFEDVGKALYNPLAGACWFTMFTFLSRSIPFKEDSKDLVYIYRNH